MLSFDRYFNSLVNWAYILSLESGEMPVQIVSLPDTYPGLQIRVCNGKLLLYFSSKTYVVGTLKNRLNETVLLSTQNKYLN